jgi:hypothetical protein
MQQRAARVDRSACARQHPRRDEIDHEPRHGDDHDQFAGHRRGIEQPTDRFDADQCDHRQHGDCIDERRQDLGTSVAVGCAPGRRPAGDRVREERDSECRGVGQHVASVREQRQRPGEPAADGFDQREAPGQDQRDDERAARSRRTVRRPMRMCAMIMRGAVGLDVVVVRRAHGHEQKN